MRAVLAVPLSRPLLALRGGSSGSVALLTASVLGSTPTEAVASPAALAAKILGYVITLGSLLLYSPMILQVLRSRSGAGLSATSWAMSAMGFGGALAYQVSRGYPVSTYGELIALTVQSIAIINLILCFDSHIHPSKLAAGTIAYGVFLYSLVTKAPKALLTVLQAVAGSMLALAIIPQLALNFRSRTCGWSRVSALLSTGGNAIRVFTTLQLTKDKLVLAGYLAGLSLNLILLTQTFVLPNPAAGF